MRQNVNNRPERRHLDYPEPQPLPTLRAFSGIFVLNRVQEPFFVAECIFTAAVLVRLAGRDTFL